MIQSGCEAQTWNSVHRELQRDWNRSETVLGFVQTFIEHGNAGWFFNPEMHRKKKWQRPATTSHRESPLRPFWFAFFRWDGDLGRIGVVVRVSGNGLPKGLTKGAFARFPAGQVVNCRQLDLVGTSVGVIPDSA